MPLLARTVFGPVAIEISSGAVERLGPLLRDGRISSGGDVAIVVGTGVGEEIAESLKSSLPAAPLFKVSGGTMESARELIEQLRGGSWDAVVGIGGGATLDVGKYAAGSLGLPFVSVATTLTHDGLASPVAVLESGGRKGSYGVHLPLAVIVDLDYVRRSPLRHTRSGIGDLVSNLSAIADWRLAERENGERVDGLAVTFARAAAESVVYRSDAMDSEGFLAALAEGLLLGGMAMSVAGTSRPCSGACHEISHAIDHLFGTPTYHGEQVAVGALFAMHLRGEDLGAVDACFRRYEVPRVPDDIGLTAEQFAAAVVEAPNTRPDRYTILEHLTLSLDDARRHVDAFCSSLDR